MTKREIAEIIAEASFPETYPRDCKAKRGFVAKAEKKSWQNLDGLLEYAYRVLRSRREENFLSGKN